MPTVYFPQKSVPCDYKETSRRFFLSKHNIFIALYFSGDVLSIFLKIEISFVNLTESRKLFFMVLLLKLSLKKLSITGEHCFSIFLSNPSCPDSFLFLSSFINCLVSFPSGYLSTNVSQKLVNSLGYYNLGLWIKEVSRWISSVR